MLEVKDMKLLAKFLVENFFFKFNRYLTDDASNALNLKTTQVSSLNKRSNKNVVRSTEN